jgi:hypothetical protein
MRTPISRARGQGSSKERSFWLISSIPTCLIGKDRDMHSVGWTPSRPRIGRRGSSPRATETSRAAMPTTSPSLLERPALKNCWRCGASFICGPQGKEKTCWCAALPAISPTSEGSDCFCPACLGEVSAHKAKGEPAGMGEASVGPLMEGEDYYREGSAIVSTATYLLRRGFCCRNGCRHCPYERAADKKAQG